jgi:hypothetical protein
MRLLFTAFTASLLCGCTSSPETVFIIDEKEYQPQSYVCQRTNGIVIDGKLDDADWQKAAWTNYFVDIEGDKKPKPQFSTRVKMMWDDTCIYFGAVMEEPDIWANIVNRDEVIFHDNDFEIFIDPDGDTHNYLEYEVNALGTIWDLLLTKPYRDNGLIINNWDIKGIRQAVSIDGTINNPSDVDNSWSIEIAIPLSVVGEVVHKQHPKEGTIWRLNFSRVQWHTDVVDGKYVKRKGSNGKNLPEENWVWSPQGVIDMHRPEMWGYLQFSETMVGEPAAAFILTEDELVKWALRHIYNRQREEIQQKGRPSDLHEIGMTTVAIGNKIYKPEITLTGKDYCASIKPNDSEECWKIRRDGYIWKE